MFRSAFQKKRCLIVAGGFYEWRKESITELVKNRKKKSDEDPDMIEKERIIKHPHYIHLKERKVFGFAGIWGDWKSPEGAEMRTCAIVTTTLNELVKPIHDRMPVIVRKEYEEEWLDPEEAELDDLRHVMQPYAFNEMAAFEVSNTVSSSKNDVPECMKPLTGARDLFA